MKTTLFTGHSLGGGLAACAAHWSNKRAITFNAMGVPSRYQQAIFGVSSRIKALNRDDKITNYYTDLDILSNAQEVVSLLSRALGKSIALEKPTKEREYLRGLLRKMEPTIAKLKKELGAKNIINEDNILKSFATHKALFTLLGILALEDKSENLFIRFLEHVACVADSSGCLDFKKIFSVIDGLRAHTSAAYLTALKEWEKDQKQQKKQTP